LESPLLARTGNFLIGPPRGGDAVAEIDERLFRNLNMKGTDCVSVFRGGGFWPIASRRGNRDDCDREKCGSNSRIEITPRCDAWSDFNLTFVFHIDIFAVFKVGDPLCDGSLPTDQKSASRTMR
jgi:hypothetical protein